MKVTYDAKTDTLSVVFREVPAAESREDRPGVILDYDESGNIVSLEVLDASRRHTWQSDLERAPSQPRKSEADSEIERLKLQLAQETEGRTWAAAEVERLKQALAQVNEERDVLKKTIAYFAKDK